MKKILTCAALSVILLSGCSMSQNQKSEDAVITVNGNAITRAQVDKAVNESLNNDPFVKPFGGAKNFDKDKNTGYYAIVRNNTIRELIVKTLIDSEVEKRNIKVSDSDVQNELKMIIDKVGSKEELNKILKERNVSNDDFMADLKTQVKIKKLVNSIEKIKISDADAEKYYKENIDQFKHSEMVRASHILISNNDLDFIKEAKTKNKKLSPEELNVVVEKRAAEQKEKAEKILKEVKANPEKFEELAKEYSDDTTSGKRGGELGYFEKEQMVPEFSAAAFSMKPNTVSQELVKTNFGYHIIKVTDRVEAATVPFSKRKDEIKSYLETQKQVKVLKNLVDGLEKTAKIEYLDKSYEPNLEAEKDLDKAFKTLTKENKEGKKK